MKLLIIGAGGIGSYFARELKECIDQGYIKNVDVTIADPDMVEVNQVMYQNFLLSDAGNNKAEVTAKKHGFKYHSHKIEKPKDLSGFDTIVLCVDNDKIRITVINYCHEKKKEFLDIRCSGRKVFAMPKLTLKENIKFVDFKDTNSYSCQEVADKKRGEYQIGNRIAAIVGLQMLINLSRGNPNRVNNLII